MDIPYSPERYVTNNIQSASADKFTAGAIITSNQEPVFHVFKPYNNPKITSYLYVKYNQDSAYSRIDTGHYATYTEALKMLEDPEAKTAHQILRSVRYKE